MFHVKGTAEDRSNRIRSFLTSDLDAPIAVIVAVAHWEWTVTRTILLLVKTETIGKEKTAM
jgi:hypothetical protein